jgi:hypothetical protein
LDWCEKKAEDVTGDGEVDKMALTITRELQAGEQKEEEKVRVSRKLLMFFSYLYTFFLIFVLQIDAIAGRRNTIHNLSQYHRFNLLY